MKSFANYNPLAGKLIQFGSLAVTLCVFALSADAIAQTADTIYHNGTVITIDDDSPRAEAMAVKDGKVIAVGVKDDVLNGEGPTRRTSGIPVRFPLFGNFPVWEI